MQIGIVSGCVEVIDGDEVGRRVLGDIGEDYVVETAGFEVGRALKANESIPLGEGVGNECGCQSGGGWKMIRSAVVITHFDADGASVAGSVTALAAEGAEDEVHANAGGRTFVIGPESVTHRAAGIHSYLKVGE